MERKYGAAEQQEMQTVQEIMTNCRTHCSSADPQGCVDDAWMAGGVFFGIFFLVVCVPLILPTDGTMVPHPALALQP